MFTFKVGVMPGKITEVAVEGGSVKEVLALADLTSQGYEIRYNGQTVNEDATINQDGTLLLVKMVKGNADVSVKIGIMPGRISEFVFNAGTTVQEALGVAELNAQGYEVRYNGTTITDMDKTLTESGTLLLVKQVKGNRREI